MIRYALADFMEWVAKQPNGHLIMDAMPADRLHTLFLNFTEEYENEAIREEMRIEDRQRKERDAAREATARKNTGDAVEAEVEENG